MNYTEVFQVLQKASLFDLYRLNVAIRHEMENPHRIRQLRQAFKEGDTISYLNETTNALEIATVIQKNPKYVVIKHHSDQLHWKITYYLLNLDKVDIDIQANQQEKLSKNHLSVGEYVGFNKEGEEIVGVIERLNYKTVTLITADHSRWRVSYNFLFRVINAEATPKFDPKQLAHWIDTENQRKD